jgi:hypothetical protein
MVTLFPDPYEDTKLSRGVVRYFIVVDPPVPPVHGLVGLGHPGEFVPSDPNAVIIVITQLLLR